VSPQSYNEMELIELSRSWDEIYAVFGDGQDYDWALEGEEGVDVDEDPETAKNDLRLEDVGWP